MGNNSDIVSIYEHVLITFAGKRELNCKKKKKRWLNWMKKTAKLQEKDSLIA